MPSPILCTWMWAACAAGSIRSAALRRAALISAVPELVGKRADQLPREPIRLGVFASHLRHATSPSPVNFPSRREGLEPSKLALR